MKTGKLIAAFAVLVIAGWACHATNSGPAPEGITFQTTQSNYVLGDTVRAVLQNNSSSSIEYGNTFQLQEKKSSEWITVGPDGYFTLEAILLSPGNRTAYRFTLVDNSDLFPDHSFSEGQYRITISIDAQDKNSILVTPSFRVIAPDQP